MWKLLTLLYAWDVWNDPFAWPFLAYVGTCCIYPLTSSAAHTFNTMSSRARHICYFFDYGALTLYTLGEGARNAQAPVAGMWHFHSTPMAPFYPWVSTVKVVWQHLDSETWVAWQDSGVRFLSPPPLQGLQLLTPLTCSPKSGWAVPSTGTMSPSPCSTP